MNIPVKNPCVYAITNLVNGKRYIGSTKNLQRRRGGHIRALMAGRHINKHLQSAWDKYGKEAFKFCILCKVNSTDELLDAEQAWLDGFKPEYNKAKNAARPTLGMPGSMKGKHHSLETRSKISKGNTGKKRTDEMKLAQSTLQKKIKRGPMPEHVKQNLIRINTGRKLTAEHKKKLSAAKTGTKRSTASTAKASVSMKRKWSEPEYRAKMKLRPWH